MLSCCPVLWMDLAVSLSLVLPLASTPVWTHWMDPGPDSSPCLVWNCWQPLCWSTADSCVFRCSRTALWSGRVLLPVLWASSAPVLTPACWVALLLLPGDTDYVKWSHSTMKCEFSLQSSLRVSCLVKGERRIPGKKGEHKEHVKHCFKQDWNSCVPATVISGKKWHQLNTGGLIQEQFALQSYLPGSRQKMLEEWVSCTTKWLWFQDSEETAQTCAEKYKYL